MGRSTVPYRSVIGTYLKVLSPRRPRIAITRVDRSASGTSDERLLHPAPALPERRLARAEPRRWKYPGPGHRPGSAQVFVGNSCHRGPHTNPRPPCVEGYEDVDVKQVLWPPGWTGRESGSEGEILDRDGKVVYRTGTRVLLPGGGPNDGYQVCGMEPSDRRCTASLAGDLKRFLRAG